MNLIKRAIVTNPGNDSLTYPISQVGYMGKTSDIENIWPYGMGAVPPKDALCIVFNVNGQEDNKSGIATAPNLRPKGLKPGEVYFSNLLTRSIIKFNADGSISITAPNIIFNGDVQINGNLNVSGNITIEGGLEVSGPIIYHSTHTFVPPVP